MTREGMTREEAITILDCERPYGNCGCGATDEEIEEALDMAIKALEHPEQNVVAVVPCGDAISRQAAIDFINNHLPFRATSEVYDAYADCVRMLGDNKALPPVTPQPKTGHWIKKDGYSDCSECGSHIVTEWDYCPKCGAKMIEPQERSDKG